MYLWIVLSLNSDAVSAVHSYEGPIISFMSVEHIQKHLKNYCTKHSITHIRVWKKYLYIFFMVYQIYVNVINSLLNSLWWLIVENWFYNLASQRQKILALAVGQHFYIHIGWIMKNIFCQQCILGTIRKLYTHASIWCAADRRRRA